MCEGEGDTDEDNSLRRARGMREARCEGGREGRESEARRGERARRGPTARAAYARRLRLVESCETGNEGELAEASQGEDAEEQEKNDAPTRDPRTDRHRSWRTSTGCTTASA